MKSITIKAYAKINLSLDVLERLSNGYHRVEMVMQQIDLFDEVRTSWKKNGEVGIHITVDRGDIPVGSENLAYKAAARMLASFPTYNDDEINIDIKKNIPVAAGLAGGSSNAAAVILALANLWSLNLTVKQMMELGADVGSDVPFCIMGQAALNDNLSLKNDKDAGTCALAEGTGTELSVLPSYTGWVLLVKPDIDVSTKKVYEALKFEDIESRPNTRELIDGLKKQNTKLILKNMANVLEFVSLKEYPIIVYTKNKLLDECSQEGVLMSGSGPTLFVLYDDREKGEREYRKLKGAYGDVFFVKSCSKE